MNTRDEERASHLALIQALQTQVSYLQALVWSASHLTPCFHQLEATVCARQQETTQLREEIQAVRVINTQVPIFPVLYRAPVG
jgi:hypothetical protein